MNKPKQNYTNIPTKDQFQTPTYALNPLIEVLDTTNIANIWEPACGEGYIALQLSSVGYDVVCTDILYGQDFFTYTPATQWDAIVTNPPYSIKYKFMQRAYELGKPFAMLVPLETIGAKKAQDMFRNDEENFSFILFNRRIKFKTPYKGWDSSPQFPSVWILHKMDFGKQMKFAEIKYTEQI